MTAFSLTNPVTDSNPLPVKGVGGSGATTSANSQSVTPATDALFKLAGSGITASATFTPTASAYSAADIMDVAKEFAFTTSDGVAIPTGSLIRILTVVLKIDQTALQTSEGAYTLQGYSVTPPSAQADNAAWTLASADLPAYVGSLGLGMPVDQGAACYTKTLQVDTDIKLTTASLWAELQTVAAFTPTAVARQVILLGVIL